MNLLKIIKIKALHCLSILILFFSLTNLYSQKESNYWDFKISCPDSLDMYINDILILNTSEFGTFTDEKITYAFDVYFRIYTIEDTLFVRCSDIYTNCDTYKYRLNKEVLMKNKIRNNKFDLLFRGRDYSFSIKVKRKHGNYIFFNDNAEALKWKRDYIYMQNDDPFLGISEPNRVK